MAGISWKTRSPSVTVAEADLSGDVPAGDIARLRGLYEQTGFLVFERQALSAARQVEVASWFGPVDPNAAVGMVSPDPKVGTLGTKELGFHTDNACTSDPLEAITLYAADVDDGATSTIFVNAVAAMAELPQDLRRRLEGRSALHLWPTMASSSARRRGAGDLPADWPGATHPVIKRHPRNGREILYLSESQTEAIVDLPFEAGEPLIAAALQHLYQDRYKHEHWWKRGDLVVWDNLAWQHGRRPLAPGVRRDLRRVDMGSHDYMRAAPAEFKTAYKDMAEA